jgi:hypothetical protein
MSIAAVALVLTVGWTPSSLVSHVGLRAAQRGRAVVKAKAPPVERGAEAPQSNIDVGSICEFHDPKHGAGKKAAVLGICESSTMKAKGGEILTLVDADGKRHTVSCKAIHICFPPAKTKATEPAEILQPFLEIADKNAISLGVEPEMLELAWEFCADDREAKKDFSPRDIVRLIDEKLYHSAVDRYRAFRLLTSDLGKVFFKTISENTFRPKSSASVKTSKEQWCHAPGHGDMWKTEFCFV